MTMHFMWYDQAQALRELDQIRDAGLTVVRFDVAWRQAEPNQKGEYDLATLTKLDTLLRAMDARGIRPIITVIETPAWARGNQGSIFTPPTNMQDYADFVAVLARRYAARPNMVWEVWNEPNLIEFWTTGINAAQYTDMLRRSYTAIKSAAPEATVLGGSIVFNDVKFLRAMYAAGAKGSFDGLAIHPYAPGRSPDDRRDPYGNFGAVEDMKVIMDANNDPDKSIWITEIGWELDLLTDETRARYLARAVELVRSWPYVRVFCVYTLNYDVGPDAQKFGLYHERNPENPAWEAYTRAARAADR
jgi:aryl-phospho-beta-D-glucosidase BglC (GH1 family)